MSRRRRTRGRSRAESTGSRSAEPAESEAAEPADSEAAESQSSLAGGAATGRPDAGEIASGRAQKVARAQYDEGVDLLQAALDQVRHHEPRPLETLPADDLRRVPPRRRGGNGHGAGNGNGARRSAGTAPPEDAENHEGAGDAEEPAHERKDVAAQRRRARARRRARNRARHGPESRIETGDDAEELDREPEDTAPPPSDPAPAEVEDRIETVEGAEDPVDAEELDREPEDREGAPAPEHADEDARVPTPVGAEPRTGARPELKGALEPVLVETAERHPAPVIRTGPGRSRRRERRVVAALAAGVLAATGVLAAVTIVDRGGSDDPDARRAAGSGDSPGARFGFAPIDVAPGATVERDWSLRGADGTRFKGTLTFSNSTGSPLDVSHTEVIPKSLATSVDEIEFEPTPTVIDADPVVQFDVTVPADDTVTAVYRIDAEPLGADRSRLQIWANDLEDEVERREIDTTTTTTTSTTTTTTAPGSTPPAAGPGGGGQESGSGATPPAAVPAPPAPPPPPPPTSGMIVIHKVSRGGTGTFGFSGPGGGVQIATSGSPDGSGQWATGVYPGTYSWTEVSSSPGWKFTGLDCSDRDAGPFEQRSTVSGPTATFNVQPGETVICTWTNRRS